MNVTLLKDVLTPQNGVGRIGQTVTMPEEQARQYIAKGLAEQAAPEAVPLPPDPAPTRPQPLTRDTLKENKAAAARETKAPAAPTPTK